MMMMMVVVSNHTTTQPKVTLMEMIFLVLLFCWRNETQTKYSWLRRMRLDDDAVVCLVFKNAEKKERRR